MKNYSENFILENSILEIPRNLLLGFYFLEPFAITNLKGVELIFFKTIKSTKAIRRKVKIFVIENKRNFYINQLKLFFITFITSSIFTAIYGEEVLLKNGSIISGRVSGITSEEVIIHTRKGTEIISKANIIKIQYTPFTPEQKLKALESLKKKRNPNSVPKEYSSTHQEINSKKNEEFNHKTQANKKEKNFIPRKSFFWRSLILPGWGQWAKNEKRKSSLFFFSSILAAGIIYKSKYDFLESQNRFAEKEKLFFLLPVGEGKILIYQGLQKDHADSVKNSNNAFNASIVLGILYAINLVDAYFSKNTSDVSLQNSNYVKKGMKTSAFQNSIGQKRENVFTIQYTYLF
ncbi:MAG: DUF5683 domain-containing protein [Leptospiraceae bacterium]|nr:hypothetical protein [Leptospiraceae bacterium]MCK6380542.1 DUF5683 domain-containing protein [Leptospiraceae bacterium]NUM41771.1 hypothetical protein [Leptospiraceae bacterium]